ncbi:MAG: hypothetical protein UT84_C0009G0020 [Candidatus Curtissbacteria bacterium GW2011_GWA1_40_16]|uniref:Insertion element IS150 protein InsJ-like helix-turn-helix domain-containing protein n=1 Tax=Candidatus Curtissbacteria bacterium GW2011_GWA1_40_16 TaxID=1618405 RepID=A0A0G0RE07_9BACT|nr:MAG: hypothetical protein UT84_C0009G0020 [Candidatus Curtissbacteria bacterium GW2011_GWA1_40_16]
MSPKLTIIERLRLLRRVLEAHESVTQVCKDAGISRVLFYKWLRRYKDYKSFSNIAKKQTDKDFLVSAVSPLKGKIAIRPHYELNTRIFAVQDVLNGKKTVTTVCREFNISKTIFYRWLKRYQQAGYLSKDQFNEHAAINALEDKKPFISRYVGQVDKKYEDLILDAVEHYPQLSSHKLVKILPYVGNRPVVGHHGVQNVLRRFNLNTYERRLQYAQQLKRTQFVFTPFLAKLISFIIYMFSLPLKVRNRLLAFGIAFLVPLGFSIVLLGIFEYAKFIIRAPALPITLGYIFATFALLFGGLFFLYSAKYYITILIVLLFSRKSFSTDGSKQKTDYNAKNLGLTPDVSGIKLDRHPFVSIL